MPVIQRKGAQSSQGFGEFAQSSTAANYIEDYFSTYLYTGTGAAQTISNGIGLADTAAWSSYKLQQNSSIGYGVTTDSSGNFYVTGYVYDGTNYYIIVAKYNSLGVIQWQRKLLESTTSIGYGITADSSGNVYVTGIAKDSGTGYDYIITAKYNSSGVIQWQRKLLQNNSTGYGITTDSSGNVYVTGVANDGTNNYIIVAKYNSSGTIQWQRKLKQNASEGKGITTDSSGNVYINGVANDGTRNYIIVAKYNSSGTIQWQRKLQQLASYGQGITADSSGNIYVTGYASDASGTYNIIAKYDSSGTIQWQRKLRQSNGQGVGITTDSSGNVYVAGSDDDLVNFYITVAKYDSSGAIQWQRKLKQNASQGYAITADTSGNVYVTGYANNGANNYLFISKLKQDGTTTSGFAFVSMVPGTATDGAGTATDSAGTATDSAAGATDSAAGATDSAGTATATSATQAAVTGGGGLVWIKSRSGAYNHNLFDTANGATKLLHSNTTAALTTDTASLTSFFAGGFNLGTGNTANNEVNTNTATFASWTFREQAKFFDVVTYTGNGANRTISHNLGSVPGCIIVKRTDTTAAWAVYHRSLANTEYLVLNTTAAKATGATYWNSTTPTSTVFSLGTSTDVNANGGTYVAYLFAHNAGGFGLAGTDNVISCGSFTPSSGSATVNLGYEPQWIFYKPASSNPGVENGTIVDVLRDLSLTGQNFLYPDTTGAEVATSGWIAPNATGFNLLGSAQNVTYIYIAIRRGPMKTPTSGTSVFSPIAYTGNGSATTPKLITNFPVDMVMWRDRTSTSSLASYNSAVFDRLRSNSKELTSSNTNTEDGTWGDSYLRFDSNTQMIVVNTNYLNQSAKTYVTHNFGRAPGFFDEVCYTGTGSNTTQTHNLGVVPELMIVRRRNSTGAWPVYSSALSNTEYAVLNTTAAKATGATYWNSTAPTSSVFSIGTATDVNASGGTYVAYLFATVAGVSKVGSYTGTAALQTINCGFTSGARFVLIKRTDSTGDWYVWDSARGISSANDPYFLLNSTAAETTSTNYVDTDTTGFQITAAAPAALNASGGTYIFLAIA